jgi:Zn-dependent membrane protease YugP
MSPLIGFLFDPWYFLYVVIPGAILAIGAQWLVKSRFAHYSRVPTTRGYTGAMAAKKLLDVAGIQDVQIVRVDGFLTDHYNPTNKQLALSPQVYDSTSVAAVGVATHEAGHAIQHATGYIPLHWRSLIVPVVQYGSPLGTYAMVGGLILIGAGAAIGKPIFILGAIAFSMLLLFQLITLPVEFNASARAKSLVVESGIVGHQESDGIAKVLNAAALTYVAAFVQTLLTLLYFLWRAGFLGGRND